MMYFVNDASGFIDMVGASYFLSLLLQSYVRRLELREQRVWPLHWCGRDGRSSCYGYCKGKIIWYSKALRDAHKWGREWGQCTLNSSIAKCSIRHITDFYTCSSVTYSGKIVKNRGAVYIELGAENSQRNLAFHLQICHVLKIRQDWNRY